MRILLFIDGFGVGGKERQLLELVKGLAFEDGVECELAITSKQIHYTYLENLGVPVHYVHRKFRKDPSVYPRFYSLCKQVQPDIVHSWNSMCSVYAAPVAKLLGITFINGFLRDAKPNLSFRDREWLRAKLTFPLSDAIVANSTAGLDAYRAPRRKAVCVHNGFDMKRVAKLIDPQDIRARFALKTENIVGMVASFSDRKDYPTFLKAAQHILGERKDVTFVAVGDGKYLHSLKNETPSRFKENIRFLGLQKNVESIINIFTIGVLASQASVHGEGISNSIMEYMALAKPVVATDYGGNRELVQENINGILIGNDDANALANGLTKLLNEPDFARRLGENGRARIMNEFSIEKMIRAYTKLYRDLLAKES
jgi:glycosyltransferase involved in cell wall biosynthesis